jgi:F-type H+-transporting ATPase subunit delta
MAQAHMHDPAADQTADRNAGPAVRYAQAVADLAKDQKAVDIVEQDLAQLKKMIADSADFRRLLSSPLLTRLDQEHAVLALAEKAGFSKIVRNLLGLMARNRRLRDVPAMIHHFNHLRATDRGDVRVAVTTASPLTEAQFQSLRAELVKGLVSQNIVITLSQDPSLIGGMVVRTGSRLIDSSVRGRLNRLAHVLKKEGNA